jgi:hypothetical protein
MARHRAASEEAVRMSDDEDLAKPKRRKPTYDRPNLDDLRAYETEEEREARAKRIARRLRKRELQLVEHTKVLEYRSFKEGGDVTETTYNVVQSSRFLVWRMVWPHGVGLDEIERWLG